MNCPNCNGSKIRSQESRHTDKSSITRRRVCADCGFHWSSIEIIAPTSLCCWRDTSMPDQRRVSHWHARTKVLDSLRQALIDLLLAS